MHTVRRSTISWSTLLASAITACGAPSARVSTEPGLAGSCTAQGASAAFERVLEAPDRACTVDADCVTRTLDCSHTECGAIHRDRAGSYPEDLECAGYTGRLANYDCEPRFGLEAPRCRAGCCVSEPWPTDVAPDHCSDALDAVARLHNPSGGPAVGAPTAEPTPPDGPEPMPTGPVPADAAAAAAHGRCAAGEAAACAELARFHRTTAGGDLPMSAQLVLRAADLEWFALPRPAITLPSVDDPVAAVDAFRRAFRAAMTLPGADEVARTYAECMGIDAGFHVVRTPRRAAFRELQAERLFFPDNVIAGDPRDLAGDGWVWAVFFVRGSRRFHPSGVFGGYVDPADQHLIVAYHVAEG